MSARSSAASFIVPSFGVASFPTNGAGPEQLILAADAALYRANRHPNLAGIGAIMSRYGVVPITQKEDLAPVQPER